MICLKNTLLQIAGLRRLFSMYHGCPSRLEVDGQRNHRSQVAISGMIRKWWAVVCSARTPAEIDLELSGRLLSLCAEAEWRLKPEPLIAWVLRWWDEYQTLEKNLLPLLK